MSLPTAFAPALKQLEPRWNALSDSKKADMERNLPDLEERLTVLKWNALVSQADSRLLAPCQGIYESLMAWESLTVLERVCVFMSGIEPVAKMARDLGYVKGV